MSNPLASSALFENHSWSPPYLVIEHLRTSADRCKRGSQRQLLHLRFARIPFLVE